ncbi:MAG: hypothetical protein OM95_12695 [Bdellovibrio sp. ArHS]|uniref:hypothetical protein n=1 Tax=Bdellovibrio sp. ArHS TaxID=1569284 RepID=UPI000582D25F|nr:hypothetical protein [Bdellovibrio sp. ArHS]KHD87853.1 MAG: hypothetical protein OM95_12695 [Bdellovibrio sp. ArHS]
MKIVAPLILSLLLSQTVLAFEVGKTLAPFQIKNQYDEKAELSAETHWVFFSSDMNAAKMLTEYLNENATKVDLSKTLIISDISKMPAFVSKMFAIPKMKKYSFKLALDRNGETTKDWPRKEGVLTVLKLSQLKIESIQSLENKEGVVAFFKDQYQP